jgi:hypothetical protein
MNSRGLDLSPADILKAEIIGAIPQAQQDDYTEKWEELEAELGRVRFAELFGHIRTIHRKQKMSETLIAEFGKQVPTAKQPARFLDQELTLERLETGVADGVVVAKRRRSRPRADPALSEPPPGAASSPFPQHCASSAASEVLHLGHKPYLREDHFSGGRPTLALARLEGQSAKFERLRQQCRFDRLFAARHAPECLREGRDVVAG